MPNYHRCATIMVGSCLIIIVVQIHAALALTDLQLAIRKRFLISVFFWHLYINFMKFSYLYYFREMFNG